MNWTSIEDLFIIALETPPERIDALLDSHPDGAVSAEVRRLLANHAKLSSDDAGAGFLQGLDRTRASALIDASDKASEPDRIGRYEIVSKLGRGATGVVYLARDPTLGREVAIKLLSQSLSSDPSAIRRFSEEARAASRLDHPNIIAIYEIGRTDDDRLFITMAYHPGETLRERIARGRLEIADAIRIGIEIAEGLAAAHASGIVHRDIKPENILLTNRGACILDFGIAKIGAQTLTKTGAALGTAAYMSPEQTRGVGVDHRSDIWSLGVVLYEMIAGVRPFRGEIGEALVYQVRHDAPESIEAFCPALSDAYAMTIMRCLEKGSALRHQSAADLAADLRAHRVSRWSPSLRRTRVAATAAGAVLAIAIFAVLNNESPAPVERTQQAKRPIQDAEAYDLYLRGTHNWNQRTHDRLQSAITLFEKAIERDPQFALPHAGLANTYINMSNYGYMRSDEALAKAMTAATRAIELDPSLAEAHASLGFLLASSMSFAKSEVSFQRALQLNPASASTHHFYSLLLMMELRTDEAMEANKRALALDPLLPVANTNRGIILVQQNKFDSARLELSRSLEIATRNPLAHYFLGAMEASNGRWAEALPLLEEAHREAPTLPGVRPALAYTLRRLHRSTDADSIVRLLERGGTDPRSRINVALYEAMSGHMDSAFAILGKAQLDVPTLIGLHAAPMLSGLRASPGYPRLLARLGLNPKLAPAGSARRLEASNASQPARR
ncbi:MAG: protein kinase [Gemmatimonadaceae bacterium]